MIGDARHGDGGRLRTDGNDPSSFVRHAPSIELQIEELVLHGFAPGDRERIGAAIERELVRLLREHDFAPHVAQHDGAARLDGGSFAMQPGAPADTIGTQVAQAVYGGLTR